MDTEYKVIFDMSARTPTANRNTDLLLSAS